MPYLTPSTLPADTICRVLFIPNDVDWLAQVTGALQELTFDYNWEAFGTVTVAQAVAQMQQMFDAFCFNEGACRVIGEIIPFAGSTSPDARWLFCDGASLLRSDYPDLFAVIGTIYGAADGTHFTLPDMRSRSPIGAGTGSGLSTYSLGAIGGEETHTLTTAETPTHTHSDSGHTHVEGNAAPTAITIGAGLPAPSALPAVGVTGAGSANLSSVGSGNSHNNIQPYLALNYLIVALS